MRRTRKSKRCGQDGVCYDHVSQHIYGKYVVHINIAVQKAPEKFVKPTVHDRHELVRHMGQLGEIIAERLFPFISEEGEYESVSS